MVTVVSLVTGDVRTLKAPAVAPLGIVMFGTVAAATGALVLVKLTAIAPGTAAHSSVTMPFTIVPPRTRVFDSVTVCARIGRTVRFNDCETPPNAAVTTPAAEAVTGTVGTVKLTSSLPAGGHAIVARFRGNASLPPSVSTALAQTVGNQSKSSSTAVSLSPSPSPLGGQVTITATVTGGQQKTPTGRVLFIVNGQVLYSHGEAQSVMPGRVLRGNVGH